MPPPTEPEAGEDGVDGQANAEVADDDFLIRKIPATPHFQTEPDGSRRISKSAFSPSSKAVDPKEGMSTNSESMLIAEGVNLEEFAPDFPALARLSVRELRDMGLDVVHDPKTGDKTHCQVYGVTPNLRKRLLSSAAFIRKPTDIP